MQIMPMGDYYEWYCDWCDSRNLTLWTRFNDGSAACGACHQSIALPYLPAALVDGAAAREFHALARM